MTEPDTGETAAREPEQKTGRRAHASRRNFMRKVFFASGATAVATMGGAGAWAALAEDTTGTADPSASAAPSGAPSGGPGGGAGGPGNQSITEDFFGLTTDGKRIDDLFTVHRQYVTPPAWDTPEREVTLDEVERWCYACLTHYPHVLVDPASEPDGSAAADR